MAAWLTLCHTSDHAPKPLSARMIPRAPEVICDTKLAMATCLTSIFFIS